MFTVFAVFLSELFTVLHVFSSELLSLTFHIFQHVSFQSVYMLVNSWFCCIHGKQPCVVFCQCEHIFSAQFSCSLRTQKQYSFQTFCFVYSDIYKCTELCKFDPCFVVNIWFGASLFTRQRFTCVKIRTWWLNFGEKAVLPRKFVSTLELILLFSTMKSTRVCTCT